MKLLLLALTGVCAAETFKNSVGMDFVLLQPGSFDMGETASAIPESLLTPLTYVTRSELAKRYPWGDAGKFKVWADHALRGDFDEHPVHRVTLTRPMFIGMHEVTNAQYEQFDPAHKAMRGRNGFSKLDDEAVVFVNWHRAVAFCEWLSKKEGRKYRLPTEAEWEYAARAGTRTLYAFGEELPPALRKNPVNSAYDEPSDAVSTQVGKTPPNAWGLFDMHGNVEEWVADWYGPYEASAKTNPTGRATGDFRVTRGGSHGTPLYFLRSANRSGLVPEAANWITGFRVVLASAPSGKPAPAPAPQNKISQERFAPPAASDKPHFRGPRPFVRIAPDANGPLFAHHNHDTAIAECPNGDMLAIWYSCIQERGRELMVASSRLRRGAAEWDPAEPFWDAPDRNDHAPALWFDGKDTLYHFNALGIAGRWAPGAIVVRTSKDSGATWSSARLLSAEFDFRSMLAQSVFRARDNSIVVAADLTRHFGRNYQGSTVWVSKDNGESWSNPAGEIPGVHAAIAQLNDGRLMALGRGGDVDGRMPMSFSSDMGRTWNTVASPFPTITGGQRAVLLRLKEGGLLFASFARDVRTLAFEKNRYLTNLFAAVSFDEGKTWPVRRVIGDGPSRGVETLDRGRVRLSPQTSEPVGYLSVTQDRAGVVHVLTSINHYEFNLAWLRQGQPAGSDMPLPASLARGGAMKSIEERHSISTGRWSNDRTPAMARLDPERGFSVELAGATFDFEAYAVGASPRFVNRYGLRVTGGAIQYFHNGAYRDIAKSDGSAHRYRLAVRADTAVQIYRGGELLVTMPAELTSSLALAARGSFLEWTGAENPRADFSGAYAP